MNKDKLGG